MPLSLLVPMTYFSDCRASRVRVEEAVLGAGADTFSCCWDAHRIVQSTFKVTPPAVTPVESSAVVSHAGVGGIGFCGAVPFDLFTFALFAGRFTHGRIQTASGSPRTRPFIRA
jgi:hypothetical protein